MIYKHLTIFYIRENITIGNDATFITNDINIDVLGSVTIEAGGTLNISKSELTFSTIGKYIDNSGSLIIEGVSGNNSIITANNITNRFYINNNAGSSLLMKYYEIDYLTGNGIFVASGSTIDEIADNFSFGVFGANCNSTQCVDVSGVNFATHDTITVNGIIFENAGTNNISRTSGTGVLNFIDASGSKAGSSFENDNGNPGTLINWTYPSSTYYTVASGNFSDPAIWNVNPSLHFSDASAVFHIKDEHNVVLDIDIDVLELLIGDSLSGTLAIGNDATIRTITVRENLTVNANASLSVGSSAIHIVEMYGNISNNGSINLRVSGANVANVNFYGQNSAVLGIGTVNFNTVTFKTGTVTTAYTMFNVLQNVVIEDNAEFNDGDLTHTIARNWTETGTGRRSGDGKIIFSGTVNTISATDNTVVEFYDVECTSAGVSVFASMSSSFSTNILGSFEVTNTREIQLVDNPMSVSGNFIVETGATFSVTGANTTVAFVGVNNQTIDLSGTVAFSNVDFDGASTKTVLGNMNIARRLTIQDGATVDGAGNHTIENGIYIHEICNFTGNLIAKGGTISSDKQIIELAHLSNLIIDGVVNITASSTLELRIFGNLDVIANYLVINSDVFIVNTGIGTFSIDDNLWMYVRSEDGFPKNFDNYNISETSNIRYDMTTSTQIIRGGVEYGNLRLRNTNKIADADIVVKGGLVIETANIEVDMAGYNLNVSGNISTNNTSTINMSVGGTLTLDAEDNNQTMGAGIYRLTNLEFTLDAPSATRSKYISVGSHIELSGDFTATCGSAGSYYLDIYFYDNEINGIAQNMTVGQNSRIRTTSIDFGDAVFSKFSGVIDLLSGTVVYDNTATTQLIANNVVYGNIAFAGTQIKEAKGNLSIKGDVFVLGNTPYFKSAGYTHSIAGNWMLGTANTRFADLNINDKIIFDGIDQIIYPSNFQHLEIANSGIDSVSGVAGNLTISGDFTVKNNAKFASKSRNMIVHGDFTIEPSGEFTQESNGTVTFEGVASNQSITLNPNSYTSTFTNNGNVQFNGAGFAYTINNSNKTFYNISFDGYSSYLLEANLNVRNDFTIYDNATVDAYVNNRTIAVSGNWNNTGNFIARNSTITFNAISANKTIDNGNSNFHNITIDAPNSEYRIINNNLKTSGNFTIINGEFNQNGFAHFFGDGVGTDYLSVTDNGIYSIGASSELRMANNSNVSISNGGLFNALGTNNFSRAVIRNQSTGSYSFEVEALGKFAAQYYHFQNMNGMGINIKTGAILDSVNNLSNGIFSNGQTGGTFLTLNNELPNHPSDEIIDNVVFNSGPTYNVTRHTGGTIVDFKDASGLLGTFDSENDIVMPADPASGLIIWSELNNAYWTGAAGDNNWHNTANWLGGVVPSILQNVTIGSTSFNPIISNDSAYARRLFIHQDATLSIDNQPLTVAEEIWIDGNLSANNNAEIFVSGNWINNGGNFVCGNSSVILNSVASENILVTNDSEFYNLEINSQGEYTADNNIRTLNNLTLSDGILNPGNFDTYVGGSWINDGGVFVAGNNTVYLQGNTNNILRAGASPFYNIVNNNTTGISLDGNLILTNNFTQAAGQLNLSPDAGTNSYNLFAKNMEIDGGNINAYDAVITVSNSWIASGTGSFTPRTSTVVMTSNSLTREITSNGSPFYNLQIQGTSLLI